MKCKIHNNANYQGLEKIAESLYNFAHKRFNFSKPAIIVFESNVNNVGKLFAPTGYYEPHTNKIVVYVDHRHPKDILRSLAHELIHHKQNCEGQFGQGTKTGPGYAQRDQHMREMEGDAYRTGNIMLFRDWEDNYKQGSKLMNEAKLKNPEKADLDDDGELSPYEKKRGAAIEKAMGEEDIEEAHCGNRDDEDVEEGKAPGFHACAAHVRENVSAREGYPINHTLMEDGSVSHYTVEFVDEIVEGIPASELTVLEMNEHMHAANRDDKKHDKKKPRRMYMNEEKKSDKEWYQSQLHEALLKKFKIKK